MAFVLMPSEPKWTMSGGFDPAFHNHYQGW